MQMKNIRMGINLSNKLMTDKKPEEVVEEKIIEKKAFPTMKQWEDAKMLLHA